MTISPGLEGGDEDLLDVGAETDPVHRPVEHAGGREPGDAEAGDERTGLPMPMGGVIGHALAAGAAPIAPKEIGRDAGFIEKDEVGRVKRGRGRRPLRARGRDVRPVLFGGAHRFFLRVKPSLVTARQMVARLAGVGSAACRSANVRSGCS